MPEFAAGDDRVAQHHGIGQSLFSADAECLPNRLSVPQDCRGRRKMAARREAADRDLGRVDMELHCVLADMQDSTGRIDQRLPAQRRLALLPTAGIIKDKDIVACLQKLHGDRVSLPRATVGIAAARQDQHGRAGVESGHFGGFLPQVADKRCAAGKGVGVALHGDSSIQ